MTQQIYNLDWFSSNEMRKYPIDSAASFVPVGYDSVPAGLMGVITDISFSLPSTYESDDDTCTGIPYLSTLSITEDLITLIICIDKIVDESRVVEPLFAFSSTQRSLYTNRYYDLKSFADGCSGVIVFGESAKTLRGGYKFLATEAKFLPSVYHKYPVFPVTSLGIQGQSAYRGNIILKGTGDIKVDTEEMTIGDYEGKVITVGLDYESSEDTIYKYNGPCDVRPVSGTCARTSIESVEEAFPNDEGNIDIKGDGIYVYMGEGKLILSTDYTLGDVCAKDKFTSLIGEDYCQIEEEEEGSDDSCEGKLKSVNFSNEVEASGIEITGQGITPISGTVPLTISALTDIQYLSVRVSRPEEGGHCKITYGQGSDYILIEHERITDSVSRSYSLLNNDTHTFPYRVNVVLDHCTGLKRADGDNTEIFSTSVNTDAFSASIELNECRLESVKYK